MATNNSSPQVPSHDEEALRTSPRYTLVYGLAADPIHQGHVNLVSDAIRALSTRGYNIVRTLIIPVYRRNPVGDKASIVDRLTDTYDHRFAMCELVTKEIAQKLGGHGGSVEANRVEEKLGKSKDRPNYSLETLRELQSGETAGTDLILLIGGDHVAGDDPEFGHWYQPDKLVQIAIIAIYPRPDCQPNASFLKDLEMKGACFVYLQEAATWNIAARKIRERLETGEDPLIMSEEGLLPISVAMYIKEHNFYVKR